MTSHLPSPDPYLPQHGDPSWSAEHYRLDLHYAVATNRLRGDVTITATAVTKVGRVVLDLAGLEVAKMTVDGRPPIRYAPRGTRLVVTLRDPVPAGESFSMAIRYSGTPQPLAEEHHGEAGWTTLEDGVVVAGLPHGAPTWFPCNDRPDDRASYSITITTQPDYTVLATGTLVETERHGSTVAWTYEQTFPMATHLARVRIGPSETAVDFPPEMTSAFAERFGPCPVDEYAAVVTAADPADPGSSARELATHWFGHAVALRGWRDVWLRDGFACYAEWVWSETTGAESADSLARSHHRRLAALDQDLLLSDPGAELMLDDRVGQRGALTLHALRLRAGDQAFFDLLRAWVAENAGRCVETTDFMALATGRLGAELNDLLDAWLHQLPLPELPA